MKTIVIIEDNIAQLKILDFFFKKKGFHMITCESAEEGLEAIEKHKDIDMITLDINLPGMNGLQLLKKLRSDASLKHIPIIMISALKQGTNVQNALEMGANDYLPKPVSLEKLEKLVETYLK